MTLEVIWHPAAEAALLRIHWRTASKIGAAVLAFATTGAGHLERVKDRPALRVLHVGTSRAFLRVDFEAGTVFVLRVW